MSSAARRSVTMESTLESPAPPSSTGFARATRSACGRSLICAASVTLRVWIHLKTCLPLKARPPRRTTSVAHSSGVRASGPSGSRFGRPRETVLVTARS